jgi:hypothetical protein
MELFIGAETQSSHVNFVCDRFAEGITGNERHQFPIGKCAP